MAMARARARTTTAAMATMALLLLAVLCLLPCAAIADVEASMPALLAHIREIQQLTKTAHGEVEEPDSHGEVEEPDLVGSLGVAEPVAAEDVVPEADVTSQLFAHIYEVQRKAAEKLEGLNGEVETETEGVVEVEEEEEKEADPGGVVDALVQERFNQLEAALKFLKDEDSADSIPLSADGAEDDDAINLLHQFVQERQQKRHPESQLENDQVHEATIVEHGEIGHGHRNNHGDREHLHGHDHRHGHRHDHGDSHANAGFSRVSDGHYRNLDHQHGETFKKKKFVLPEEIAEEEDLLQNGFEGQGYPNAEQLGRLRGPKLG